MELLSEVWIWEEKNMDWKHIGEATAVTSTMMVIGARVAGPWGLAIVGAVGGLLGAWRWWRYKSVPKRLKELTSTEKKNLYRQVMAIVRALDWTDFEELTEQVVNDKAVQEKLLELTMSFVTHKMGNA
ncbi:protein C19orf12-like [Eptesicus fuscus]|uniref:protein C19orf12-like n=1 Tax=Eptesicus fuscus TaxID=29078 RepID=UPI002403B4EE|nr:protein C19orf12-like [Eptesicus fuscus]